MYQKKITAMLLILVAIPTMFAQDSTELTVALPFSPSRTFTGYGKLGFPCLQVGFFMKEYAYVVNDLEITDTHPTTDSPRPSKFTASRLKQNDLGWFPDLNSREYEPGYNQTPMSAGEQVLYSLGMVLMQMTAFELDRSINK